MKRIIAVVFLFFIFIGGTTKETKDTEYSDIKPPKARIDLYDEIGRQDGFWRDHGADMMCYEIYYKSGKEIGPRRESDDANMKLYRFITYKEGEITNIYYIYNGERIRLVYRDIKKGKYPKPRSAVTFEEYFEKKCYWVEYYPNGQVLVEGACLFNGEYPTGNCFEIGEFKYYDQEGKLVKTEFYE